MKQIISYSAVDLGKKIQAGELSVIEAVEATLETLKRKEEVSNSFITVARERALLQAVDIQAKIKKGLLSGPLAGVPFAVKDNICVSNLLNTCGSNMLSNYVPPYSATAFERLEQAGAILIGKTNMDEFAMGNSTETSAYGVTRNPWNCDYVAGGSSGGTAAAVANGSCYFGLGSDTGGSVRQPAAFCGVVGMKPTYGTVSRYGLVAYASSFDQIGPIGKDVTDCATILEAIASYDKHDATSIKRTEYNVTKGLIDELKGMKIGLPIDYFAENLSNATRKSIRKVVDLLKEKGAIVEEFYLGMREYLVSTYYIIASAEASANLARYDGIAYGHRATTYEGIHEMYQKSRSEGFGTEVKRRIMLGSFVLSSDHYDRYYQTALKSTVLIKEVFREAFTHYDVIITPVTEKGVPKIGDHPNTMIEKYQEDILTIAANLTGNPAMSVPCGWDESGLPIGVQFIADAYQERKMIQVAFSYECSRGNFAKGAVYE